MAAVSPGQSVTVAEEAWPPGPAVGLGRDSGLWVSVSGRGLLPGPPPGIAGGPQSGTDHAAHCRDHQQPFPAGFPCLV